MPRRMFVALIAGLLMATFAGAKNKAEKSLPDYILSAKTVAVIIDPQAGIDVDDPRANQVAQKDVETALLNWGRFQPTISTQRADLIIVIRKGHKGVVDTTISDPRQNNRVGVIDPTANGVSVGAQHGRQPEMSGAGVPEASEQGTPHPQTEIGGVGDSFTVYNGDTNLPLDSPAGWRYVAKDGLRSHNVPAVDEFKKAVAAADKAAAAKHP
ncbi:hypothetical protein [Tunturiibacter gelidoferens]|uniref:Uncharacterized protein n=2 Tax=Tunturiibacter TaxID=3154218 RepID=A0A7Y9NIX9_9BACT|nr:hypothetical protein [Edaphobacter lichenicola]MBB5340523.1 hypothetical protein [Edaphobacter lichenicola]NYF50163.1 hypothetical protein [Edaphobacter lichenicola]